MDYSKNKHLLLSKEEREALPKRSAILTVILGIGVMAIGLYAGYFILVQEGGLVGWQP